MTLHGQNKIRASGSPHSHHSNTELLSSHPCRTLQSRYSGWHRLPLLFQSVVLPAVWPISPLTILAALRSAQKLQGNAQCIVWTQFCGISFGEQTAVLLSSCASCCTLSSAISLRCCVSSSFAVSSAALSAAPVEPSTVP